MNSFINGLEALESPMDELFELKLLPDQYNNWNSNDLTERLLSSFGKFKAITNLDLSIPGEIRN